MPLYRHVVNAWHEMRPSTWQLFNGITLPFVGTVMILTEKHFLSLPAYAAMRAWASIYVWSVIFLIIGVSLLLTRVGSCQARVALFLASMLWLVIGTSMFLAVGFSALGPPVYWTLSLFTAKTFIKSRGVRSARQTTIE